MQNRTITAGFWCLFSLAACATETPNGSTPVVVIPATLPPSVPLEQFLSVRAAVECAQLFRCAPIGDAVARRASFVTLERCIANDDELTNAPTREQSRRLVATGVQRYDGDAARRCLEAYRADLCPTRVPAACAVALTGATPLGEACTRPDQCAGDAFCDQSTDLGGYTCPGRCVARHAVGERCRGGDANSCSQSSASTAVRCEYDNALGGTPQPFRCVADRSDGALPIAEGQVCYDYTVPGARMQACAEGLDCRNGASSGQPARYTCQLPPSAGQLCASRCTGEAVCEFDQSVFQQRCLAVVVRNSEGDTCVQGNRGGEVCNVLLGLDCVAGRCRRVGTGAEGSVCFSSRYGFDNCQRGLYCDDTTGTCRPRKADAASCRSAEECQSRACVPNAMGTGSVCGVSPGCR